MYTFKVEQAIQAAALLHEPHQRKGSVPIPYITHLIAVTLILRDYTSDEDTLVAALLHDTLEDTEYTESEMSQDFGEQVTTIVRTLTEPADTDSTYTWLERKRLYAKQLKQGPLAAVEVAAADKIHNFRSMIDEYHNDHLRFLQEFSGKPQERLEGYQTIANVINSRIKDGIVHEFNHTFELYKQFILDVQEKSPIY
jgi:(p)ppGpp synthase/HD superfamily hydrolase